MWKPFILYCLTVDIQITRSTTEKGYSVSMKNTIWGFLYPKHLKGEIMRIKLLLLSLAFFLFAQVTALSENYNYSYDQRTYSKAVAELVATNRKTTGDVVDAIPRSEAYTIVMLRMLSSATSPSFGKHEPDILIAGPHNLYTAAYLDENDASAAIELLKNDPSVRYVEKDSTVEATEVDFSFQSYGANEMGFSPTLHWTANAGAGSVVVAVIDSGVYNHKALSSRLTQSGFDYVDGDSDSTSDANGHGTHVAGIVADCTQNLPVYIMPIRVLDASASGSKINTANAIFEAADMGCEVINLSLSSISHSDALDDAVLFAIDSGSTVVISAGNNSANTSKYCPVHMLEEGLIVVAACSGTKSDPVPASYSNYGASVDLYAFGDSIRSCSISGGYSTKSGTSQAAPHISAACAIMKLLFPDSTPQTIEHRLKRLAGDAEANVPHIALLTPETTGCTATQITLPMNSEFHLLQTAKPETCFLSITWSTSDETIAKVDETGILRCLSPGTVTLTGDGDANADFHATLHIAEARDVLRIPPNTLMIESKAFSCLSSDVLQIPSSVISIDEDAFLNSTFSSIILLGNMPHLSQFIGDTGITAVMSADNPLWSELDTPYLLFVPISQD